MSTRDKSWILGTWIVILSILLVYTAIRYNLTKPDTFYRGWYFSCYNMGMIVEPNDEDLVIATCLKQVQAARNDLEHLEKRRGWDIPWGRVLATQVSPRDTEAQW